MPRSALLWAVILIAAGVAAVAVCVLTAPAVAPGAPRDILDSPALLPAFAALAVLAGLAAWAAPHPLWGAVAAAPFFVYFAAGVAGELREGGQGMWPVGLMFLIGLTLLPLAASLVTSLVARSR
ncbi:hypothetical protein ACFFV7_32155 [Nonomuraea spiralis]|uniref:Integral membrane protein n=1 Tax=Nonomuraea spiralis TaxID=46182 RepID=A0ABV5IMY8_9ACTN|nr:hypothetical protein [Nonomuraea spiralis]GGT27423.1 hypothetical protein GCM10010176_085060 [Nonomuraea spiralis]